MFYVTFFKRPSHRFLVSYRHESSLLIEHLRTKTVAIWKRDDLCINIMNAFNLIFYSCVNYLIFTTILVPISIC